MRKIWILSLFVCCVFLSGCKKLIVTPEIIEETTPDEQHWIIHNIEKWTITLDNWEESITIMDRNL